MNEYSREKIKLRMLKRIASLWDIPDVEHIDPVVRLLIEAMAEEIFLLAGEISQLDDRMLAKLSLSMTPVDYLAARPAHALLSAMPTDAAVAVDGDTVFEYKESRLLRKYNLNSIRFTPIVPYELIRAKIASVGIGNWLYKCDRECRKNLVALAGDEDGRSANVVWIGVDFLSEAGGMRDLSLYFDFAAVGDKSRYLRLLPYARWTADGKEAEVAQGLGDEAQNADLRSLYDLHYLTLRGIDTDRRKKYPEEWESSYSREALSALTTPLLWIEAVFPDSVPGDVLDTLKVGINLFPVANLSRRTMTRKMTDVSMFMPLDIGKNEYFVGIESVRDSSGRVYEPLSQEDAALVPTAKGTYSLRRGGVELYSHTNDAKSAILRLLDIIADRHLFSNNRAEVEFEQIVNKILALTDKVSHIAGNLEGESEPKSYIVVDKSNPGETLMVDYRVTNGEVINNFRPAAPLFVNNRSAALEEGIYFLTPVRGGTPSPSIDRVKDLHRYLLTSHDRIFTKQDILNFCKAEYGPYISDIGIKSGVTISPKPLQGVMKTIDVHIRKASGSFAGLSDEEFREGLKCKLERRSPESFNYRIFITN